MHLAAVVLVAAAAWCAPPASAPSTAVVSGAISVSFKSDLGLSIHIAGQGLMQALPPSPFFGGAAHPFPAKLHCSAPGVPVSGGDRFGAYQAISINCSASATAIDYSVKAYGDVGSEGAAKAGVGDSLVIFEVSMPGGATGLRMRPVTTTDRSPPQFAPFPAFDLDASPALSTALAGCYGEERPHLGISNGVAGMSSQCTTLSGGMTVLGWEDSHSPTSLAGAVVTAANEFHLSYNRLATAPADGHGLASTAGKIWSHGLSGEITSVPRGFAGQTMIYFSPKGLNAAVDGWGVTLRRAYKTTKRDAEDPFLQTLSVWTDNGAALNGVAWQPHPGAVAPPAPGDSSEIYLNLNWSMVDEAGMGAVMDSVVASSGVTPRATQIDCWWYPTTNQHQFYCGLDWVPPARYFPKGMAGVHERLGTPLMLYMPAVCTGGGRWAGKYNWSNTASAGWVLPLADEMEAFFDELFAYGIATSTPAVGSKSSGDPWPGVWAPPMVKAGWSGTHVSGYETDFFSDLEADNPEARGDYGKGERLLESMDAAAAKHNLTVQICGGTVPDFLKSLTLPTITNARATTDYDGEQDAEGINHFHNYDAADNAWPFWGTRMGVSKDNFWTAYKNLSTVGNYSSMSRFSQIGHNAEVHAVSALLTGVVGLGDWHDGMTNGTLVRRLARADGVLLKPDRPLAPMDLMLGSFVNATRRLPGIAGEPRAWSTHVTCATESPDAPELMKTPTRRLVSHVGYDATLRQRVPDSLVLHHNYIQWLVVGINATSLGIRRHDLYPLPNLASRLASRTFYRPVCRDGVDPFAVTGGCLDLKTGEEDLFDIAASTAPCPGAGLCRHILTYHTVFEIPVTTVAPVLLGDLNTYASLSGYRFRLVADDPARVIVVGQPGESVEVTYMVPNATTTSGWVARVQTVVVGNDGRRQITME